MNTESKKEKMIEELYRQTFENAKEIGKLKDRQYVFNKDIETLFDWLQDIDDLNLLDEILKELKKRTKKKIDKVFSKIRQLAKH